MGKRARHDSAGLFLSRLNAGDFVNGEINRPGGFIEGRIYSTNPNKNEYTIDIHPNLNSKAKAVYLDIVIEVKLQRQLGELLVGDHLQILLEGAGILPRPKTPTHLPVILRYREGITVLLVSRAGPQGEKKKLLSVWPNQKTSKSKKRKQTLNVDNLDVEWFSTPPPDDGNLGVGDGTSGTQAATGGPSPTNSSEPLPTPPADAEMENVAGLSTSATASMGLTSSGKSPLTTGEGRGAATYAYRTAPSRERSSVQQLSGPNAALPSGDPPGARNCSATSEVSAFGKQKSNKKKKREKEESKEAASSTAPMSPATTNTPTTPTTSTTVEDKDIRSERVTVAQPGGQQSRSNEDIDDTGEIVNGEPILDDLLNMRAGLVVDGWPYTALSEIRHSVLSSLIGVVSFIAKEPTQTQKGDWCICFSLLDPSVLDSFGGVLYTSSPGIKINCFMRVEQWLPNPKQGDVILLRQVKIQRWNDNLTGTCYANTMQWAIYDPLTEEVLQPDPKLNSHRFHNPPTWHIVPQEREYCVQLTQWWGAVQKARIERQGTAVQIGGGLVVASERKQTNRQHLLISEADPGREPRGYFNCTVEMLHGHANLTPDIYSIYVTDYTSKSGTFAEHSSEWCPVSLADRVLRIEMWRDKAVTLAQRMNPGEYWSLDNVRMKVSNEGYIEGSLSEADKARKLSTVDLDLNPHLRALIQRKKVWEEKDTNPHVFPHKLFEEVEELQSIFDCTVEVLHAEYNVGSTSILYITDYTERSDLATPPIALWSRELEGRIVTLELQGQQSKMADKMEIGSYFTVKHMRLIERVMGFQKVVGRIGGPDRLIHKLNVNNPDEELEKLLQRKNRWKGKPGTARRSRRNEGFTTIARVLNSDKLVHKFRVYARVVGTYPLRLEGCVVRSCKSCSEQLPAGMDTCTPCTAPDGATPECENVFHLFLRLQDEGGQAQITVTVDQNSSILGGLMPDDVMGASGTTQKVRERLAGYIGNLEAVQVANSQGITMEAKVPVREFTIESWYVEDGVIAYGLL